MNKKLKSMVFITLSFSIVLGLFTISCDDETPKLTACLWVVSFQQSEGLKLVNAGGTYNFIRQINNDGPAVCNDITLRYFLSTDEVINNSDTYLNAQETLNLVSGGYSVSGINLTIPSSVTPGTKYYIGVLINASSCTSNCSSYKSYDVTISGSTPTDTACLFIPNWHLEVPHDGHSVTCGQTHTFDREVANDGPKAANNIKVRYYLSTDSTITTEDTYLGVEETLNLAVGGRSWTTVNLPIPSGLNNGQTYYVGILITSSSCTNTCAPSGAWNVTVSCPTTCNACLWIPNWHLEVPHDGHSVTCGQTHTFDREVANDGPAAANNIIVRYYLSTDSTITTSDTYLGVEETLNLAVGGRSWTTVNLPIPSGLNNGQTYYVGILITSSSCTNTCAPSGAWNVTVSCPTTCNACLWIPNWHLEVPHDGHSVTCGQTHTFDREVANDGPAAANNIIVRYYLSTDSTITTSDTYLGVEETLNLAVGGRSWTTVNLPIPSGLNNGQTYYVGILITSSSCTNTCAPSGAWNVTVSCPTTCNACLWIPNWHLEVPHDGHSVTCGQTHTFDREVANDGPSVANNIKVRYYLSTNSTITTSDTYLGVEETLNLAVGGRSWTTVNLPIPSGLINGQTYYVGILITSSSCTNTCAPSGAWNVTASCP